jgi:hypothetical protein
VAHPDPSRRTEVWLGNGATLAATAERDLRDSAVLSALCPAPFAQYADGV